MVNSAQAAHSGVAVGWGLWLLWVLASTAGWGIGGPAGVAVSTAVSPSRDIIVGGFVGVAAGGIAAGLLQWLVLRPYVAGAGWWVLTGIVAVAAVGMVIFAAGVVNRDVGWVLGVGLLGTALGALQWLVLRAQVAGAGWWVLVSSVGWIVGGPVAGLLGWTMSAGLGSGWVVLGAAYGAITGPALVWLLRQ